MATMKSKSISYNIDLPEEKDLFVWSNAQKNFSGYVKELIAADKKKKPVADTSKRRTP